MPSPTTVEAYWLAAFTSVQGEVHDRLTLQRPEGHQAVRDLKADRLRVPEVVSVVGFDDIVKAWPQRAPGLIEAAFTGLPPLNSGQRPPCPSAKRFRVIGYTP